MIKYALSRILQTIPVIFVVSIIVFLILHLVPGDPIKLLASPRAKKATIQRLRERWGLDEPLHVQYGQWIWNLLHGDMGESIRHHVPVSQLIGTRYLNTLRLTSASMFLAVLFGVPMGIAASLYRNSIIDTVIMGFAVAGFSIPPFWLGLILLLVFSVNLDLLPAGGGASMQHLILPAVSLGIATMALIARMMRSTMLEVLGSDYIRTARSKGLSEKWVILVHSLKNALIPIVTIIGVQFGVLMAGAVVTEVVFTWPGIGWLMVDSIKNRDFPIIRSALLITSVTFIMVNLVVDLLYGFLDPRITYD